MNPNSISDLRNIRSQGANVGDIRDFAGWGKGRWSGESWSKEGGGNGSPVIGTPQGSNSQTYIQDAVRQMQEANKPAIQSYEASIPETQTKFATQRQSVADRYKNLIASIKGNQQVAETRQTVTTQNELGRRGITSSSGIAQQAMTDALNPITQQYTGLEKEAVTSRGAEEATSVSGESETIRAIRNAIASLQSGAATQGVQLGTNQFNADQALAAQQRTAASSLTQQNIENKMKEIQLGLETKKTAYDLGKPYYAPKDSTDNGLAGLFKMLGGNITGTSIAKKTVTGRLADGRYLWSDGSAGWTGGI